MKMANSSETNVAPGGAKRQAARRTTKSLRRSCATCQRSFAFGGGASLLAATIVAVIGLTGGCSSPAPYEFDAMDLTPTQDEMLEFSLGKYSIPVPIIRRYEEKQRPRQNRIEFGFELYALIPRDYEHELTDSWERHEGKIRDRIIRVCRTATLEELQEPELATLKGHLTDAVQSQLGREGVRRLLIAEVRQREL